MLFLGAILFYANHKGIHILGRFGLSYPIYMPFFSVFGIHPMFIGYPTYF